MEGIQSQAVRSQTQSDNGNQPARPLNSYGFGKQVGSDGVGAEDWCDSGLECLNGALSLETPFCTESEHPPTLKSTPFDICSRKIDSEHEPTDSCISLGNGERLDSALGHSITDEMLGCISQGIGTIQLSEPDSVSGDRSGEVIGGQVGAYPPEEVFNTLNFVSEDGDTALHLALIHEHLTFVHYLVGVITLDQNWTPYLDIQNDLGQRLSEQLSFAYGIAVNLQLSEQGVYLRKKTALHLAVIVDQPDCVKALLWGGASAEIQERGGNTPLHLAVRESRVACVRELTCSGIRPDHLRIINYSGVSALHLAVQKGNEEIVHMLLEGGADVNQRDLSSGRSPLHWAVESQSATLVRLLLRAGAAVDQPSYAGHSPLYCALHRPNAEVQALLRDGGGTEMHGGEDEDEEDRESEEDEFDDLVINGHRVL